MADELYEARNCLLLGNFHQAIADGTSAKTTLKKPEDIQAFNADRELLLAKAQIGLGQYDAVIAELRTATRPSLLCARHFAIFHKERAAGRNDAAETSLGDMLQIAGETPALANVDAAAMACSALLIKKDTAAALKMSSVWAAALDAQSGSAAKRQVVEMRALVVDSLLRWNRPDLAEKEVAVMKSIDDEAVPTLLSHGVVLLRQGVAKADKYREALNIFQEIIGRCGATVSLLNLVALCHLGLGKPAEAERCLLDALAKRSGDPDTTANLAVVSAQLAKAPDMTARFVSQAKGSAAQPMAVWGKTYAAMEDRFRDACATLAASAA